MAITETEVHVVCFQILKEGQMPTFKMIRSRLGERGSNTTITKYRDTWLERLDGGFDNPALSDIPSDLKTPIQTMWTTALELAQNMARNEINRLKSDINSMNSEINHKNQKIKKQEDKIAELASKNEHLFKSNGSLNVHIGNLKEELETLTKDNAELITITNKFKDESVDLEDEVRELKSKLERLRSELESQNAFTQELMNKTASALKSYDEQKNDSNARAH